MTRGKAFIITIILILSSLLFLFFSSPAYVIGACSVDRYGNCSGSCSCPECGTCTCRFERSEGTTRCEPDTRECYKKYCSEQTDKQCGANCTPTCNGGTCPSSTNPTNTPRPGPTSLPPDYCTSTNDCQKFCPPSCPACSSVCLNNRCYTTNPNCAPTGGVTPCNTWGSWGSCTCSQGAYGGCASTNYCGQTQFCANPVNSNQYNIACCTPSGGGGGGGGAPGDPPTCDNWASIQINACTQEDYNANPRASNCITYTRNVTLNLNSQAAAQMSFANVGPNKACSSGSYSAWKPYDTRKLWTLSANSGAKKVCLRVRNPNGKKSCFAKIEYRAPAPGPWVKLKNASFASLNPLTVLIPLSPLPYDADDQSVAEFIIGGSSAGLVTAPQVNLKLLNPNALPQKRLWPT